jgi:signal transduction histidine kinase
VNQQSVLIIADQPAFARDLVSHWQMERVVPTFTVISNDFPAPDPGPCELAIIDATSLRERKFHEILQTLEGRGIPVICVVSQEARFQALRTQHHRALPIKQNEEWLGAVVVLGTEVLRRQESAARQRRAEQVLATSQNQAVLGRFMLDARHNFNNALTSVLGNAELLMMESASLSIEMREQVETIHSMALRLHEMMQRFSSIEAEMQFAEREGRPESQFRPRAYASGT